MKFGTLNVWWLFLIALLVVAGTLIWALRFSFFSRKAIPDDMVLIAAGEFTMGSDEEDREGQATEMGSRKPWYLDEHPRHKVALASYFMDKYEVTNAQYKKFWNAMRGRQSPTPQDGAYPPGQDSYPAVNVSWYAAHDFCDWAGKRLPTETEWEKAARGSDGLTWPWGNKFSAEKANTGPAGIGGPRPVGSFPQDRSPYGIYDLAGNVREWTASWYGAYPGNSYSSQEFGEQFKVVRGDSWGEGGHYYLPHFSRAAFRLNVRPEERYDFIGFRCAKDAT